MNDRIFRIYHEDTQYALAAAAVFAGMLKGAIPEVCTDPGKEGVYIMEGYKSAAEFLSDAGMDFGPGVLRGPGSAVITGFTSGAGGTGVTSSALNFGRILSSLETKKTAYISFDFLSAKCPADKSTSRLELYESIFDDRLPLPAFEDEYGLFIISPAEGFSDFAGLGRESLKKLLEGLGRNYDAVVLDIPLSPSSLYLYGLCDFLVICYGFDESRYFPSEKLKACLMEENYGELLEYRASKDEFPADLFGVSGTEVRELAERIIGS